VDLNFAIKGFGPAFASFTATELSEIDDNEYNILKNSEGVNAIELDKSFFTKAKFPKLSQIVDSSSWLNKERLKFTLEEKEKPITLVISWNVNRKNFQDVQTATGSVEAVLKGEDRDTLAEMLSDCSPTSKTFTKLNLSKFLSGLFEAPLKNSSRQMKVDTSNVPTLIKCCPKVQTTLKNLRFREAVKSVIADRNRMPNALSKEYFALNDAVSIESFKLFIYSTKLPKYNFSSFNLIGLYATVVLAVAQLLRLMHSDMTTRIPLDELPNPMPLLNMYRQILMVREMGDYESEEAIYWQLIEMLRNPQLLIEMTKIN
jgi:hypothetical protein